MPNVNATSSASSVSMTDIENERQDEVNKATTDLNNKTKKNDQITEAFKNMMMMMAFMEQFNQGSKGDQKQTSAKQAHTVAAGGAKALKGLEADMSGLVQAMSTAVSASGGSAAGAA